MHLRKFLPTPTIMGCLLLCFAAAVATTAGTASSKPEMLTLSQCHQSTPFLTAAHFPCEKAIDGNVDGHLLNAYSCSHVNDEPTGWWSAKVTRKALIASIRIYNRVDELPERLTDFTISVDDVVCASYQSSQTFAVKNFPCNDIGQEIKISSRRPYLTLCEVQAFGEYFNESEMLPLRECYQSSTSENGDCKNAMDGNTDGHHKVSHSCSVFGSGVGWWGVLLVKQSLIKFVRIYNRVDCCADRLTDFTISVDELVQCASYKSKQTFISRDFECKTVGQSVEIRSQVPFTALCEVQVFGESFHTRKRVRQCLRPQFVKEPAVHRNSERACAKACFDLDTRCQGFMLAADNGRCQIFEFDKCSHNVTTGKCDNFDWVYVRKQPNLPYGKLCPEGYGHSHYGSTYKLVSVNDWSGGESRCGAEMGLNKYADASDKAETDYMHWLKVNAFSGTSFFIGGHKDNNAWKWKSCNTPVLPEVWGPWQPNDQGPSTDIWIDHKSGVDDTPSYYHSLKHALCECVDPFA